MRSLAPRRRSARFRSAQFRLNFDLNCEALPPSPHENEVESEAFDDALEATFPAAPLTEDQLYQEFQRLFPDYRIEPEPQTCFWKRQG